MHHVSALIWPALCASAMAQDILFYKFDGTCSSEVINYAQGGPLSVGNGVIQSSSPTGPITSGRFGDGLAGGNNGSTGGTVYFNRVLTGWQPSLQPLAGDLTMAFFIRQSTPFVGACYLGGTTSGTFRMFTDGIAGRGLYVRDVLMRGGAGGGADAVLNVDIQTLSAAGYVHIALVVDSTMGTAQWYVNGAPTPLLPGVAGAIINSAGEFRIGFQLSASNFDFDEFLISRRVYSATEVAALASHPHAGHGPFSSGATVQCGTLGLGGAGGLPRLGNANYRLVLSTTNVGFFLVLVGFDRCQLGGSLPLPISGASISPAAIGCSLLVDPLAVVTGSVAGGGPTTVPFAIPQAAIFDGADVFLQAALMTNAGVLNASNGFALAIGN